MQDKILNNDMLIPFGLDKETHTLVDVHSVPNGEACNCICPSCHLPLIARQGDINQWHFAHSGNKKKTSENIEEICQYSFFSSVRMMALQMFGQNLKINLPSYSAVITDSYNDIKIKEEFVITEKKTISLTNIETDQSFQGHKVDVIGKVKDYSFIIVFEYPNKRIPFGLLDLENEKCGIISISLEPTRQLFSDARKTGISYKDSLNAYIQTNLPSKNWLYHPKYKKAERLARKRLGEKKQQSIKNYKPDIDRIVSNYNQSPVNSSDHSGHQVKFHCMQCNKKWQAKENQSLCPECNSPLYVKRI